MGFTKGTSGNPFGRRSRTEDQAKELILSNLIATDAGCWEWTRSLDSWGYGHIGWRRKMFKVHRLAAYFWLGIPLDTPLKILHHCDNPKCFNPCHLFVGTDADNSRDCTDKGR